MGKFQGDNWYVMRNGAQIGPLPEIEVRRLAKEGTLEYDEMLWRPGMKQWVTSGSYEELFPPPAVPIESKYATQKSNISDKMANSAQRGPAGLGGWLILVTAGLFLSPPLALTIIILDFEALTQGVTQAWYNLLFFEGCAVFLVGICLPVWLIISFFQHKKDFPQHYVYFLWSAVAIHVVQLIVLATLVGGLDNYIRLSSGISRTTGLVVAAVIWTLYIKRSKRVANTFDIVGSERWQLITMYSVGLFFVIGSILCSLYLLPYTGRRSLAYSDSSNRLVRQPEVAKAVADPYQDAVAAIQGRDYARATQLLRPLAERGDARAQAGIGLMYEYGQGVFGQGVPSQDYAQALAWYFKSADQGYAYAQYSLGSMYENGRGVSQDHSEAVKWWGKAAQQGLPQAQSCLSNRPGCAK